MKLRDAEQLLQAVKLEGPLTEPWSVLTDEGILLEAWPLGFAHGSIGLREAITIFTEHHQFALFEGSIAPHVAPRWSPRKMWQQELFVYLRELREAMGLAMNDLHRGPLYPRPGEAGQPGANSATIPMAEDFHLYPAQRFVRWTLEGPINVSIEELELLKTGFYNLLKKFCLTKTHFFVDADLAMDESTDDLE